ncbi:MAG: methionine adenosyltransferase [Oscillospiraceae bacterium]|nr:methionine adenosyltransferase [Oscillospiraceae bacterium]
MTREGSAADTGFTGRKIIVDTYVGYSRHGDGTFSGEGQTKVDGSAAYYARYIAKNVVVVAEFTKKCEVQISYAIGVATLISVFVETFETFRFYEGCYF